MTQERRRETRTTVTLGGDSPFDDAGEPNGLATVSHGPYAETLPVAGMSVGEVRRRFGDRLDIDPEAVAVVDGREVGDGHSVTDGQLVTFVRRAGEKGAR